jgi:pyruvate,water dikinase
MDAMDVVWFGSSQCDDPAIAGGKAARLSQLAARYPVPPGFCVPAAAFDPDLAARLQRLERLERLEGGAEPETAAPPGAGPGTSIPAALQKAVQGAYEALAVRCADERPAVAVRSSAVDEDGGEASFAGQHETYLNVSGAEAVTHAVARCWASALAPRALEYRRRQGLAADAVRLAVLVQQLVVADVSAVVFSAHPVTGDRGLAMVTASWGLGESVVGGTVTPDTYLVRKRDLAVVDRQVADKARMTVAVPAGTREVDVPRLLRRRPALDDAGAAAMARLAVQLEGEMGWPVDVECAIRGDRLYLLQCRPVTTLAPAV